ncbi:MAG: biotin--[acetyl-CoA-carboxylase] ligase [Flavobacteriales bacterium]|nr:biotin--[acetyl-CoA-carboxylase] ligase [Flavobacteriales bacterium]
MKSARYIIESCHSTNDTVKEWLHSITSHQSVAVLTYDQLAGRGQRGRKWYSTPYESLIMSLGFREIWPAERPVFPLLAHVSSGVAKFLQQIIHPDLLLKWPNDLFIRDLKIGGLLVETQWQGSRKMHIILGLGVNLNQSQFPEDLPGAVSAHQVTGRWFNPEDLFHPLCDILEGQVFSAPLLSNEELLQDYIKLLDGWERPGLYQDMVAGEVFEAALQEVMQDGTLLLKDTKGSLRGPFRHHEIRRLFRPWPGDQIFSGEIGSNS